MTKFATISILGRPNVGKSTLLNLLIEYKLSIVTPKVQTTRNIINGIRVYKEAQFVFLDTPGIFEPKKTIDKLMVKYAWNSIGRSEMVILVLDPETLELLAQDDNNKNPNPDKLTLLKVFDYLMGKKLILAINKVDLLSKKESLALPLPAILKDYPTFYISALYNYNIPELLEYLYSQASEGEWIHDEEDITTLPSRFIAEEITREQLFLNLHQELPYNVTVKTEKWEQPNEHTATIYQTIITTSENHKKIILGHKGEKIKKVGSIARVNIEQALNLKVHLFLFVKVRSSWLEHPEGFINP